MDQELLNQEVENKEEPEAEKIEEPEKKEEPSIDEMLGEKVVAIEKEADDFNYAEEIEKERKIISKKYRNSRIQSNVAMGVALVLVAGAFILILQKLMVLNIIGYSLGGAALVGMIVFYFVNRKSFPDQVKEYIKKVTKALNGHVFKHGDYDKLTTDESDKMDIAELLPEGVYRGASNIASRNVVKGEFQGRSFKVADIALREIVKRNQQKNVFVGKYVFLVNDLHFEGRYVIVSSKEKEEERVDLPNAIDDLVLLEEGKSFNVYGPKDAKYKDDLGTKFLSMVKNIKIEKDLLNLSIVIWAGHSAAYLSYTDAIIALPFERPFTSEAYDNYTSEQLQLLNALKTLTK